ncbi:hypothetical protein Riv7116_6932 (plasmid) [Rivularia sp. PCC 7116]|uniref:hypothetical protein n=1 Tax=Rivularia sp. PCC 7116 TaxID=373994 RepID=UPI00029EC613|nr:hypothetical protein [Rivularia sp. PCC 7116]AFY59244.1 hypothetical protein Riv7116_6932 [Rivularia sp. PCC 7116]
MLLAQDNRRRKTRSSKDYSIEIEELKVKIKELSQSDKETVIAPIEGFPEACFKIARASAPSKLFKNKSEYDIFKYNWNHWELYFDGYVNQRNVEVDKSFYISVLKGRLKQLKELNKNR